MATLSPEPAAGRIAVARNANGTLIVFYVGVGHDVLYTQQTSPSGGWTPWQRLSNASRSVTGKSLAVAQNQDDRLELFLVGTGNEASPDGGDLLHAWQTTPGGTWTEWSTLLPQDSVASPANGNVIAAARNADGTLVVFAIKPDLGVHFSEQLTPSGGWSAWQPLTNAALAIKGTSLAVAQNLDGRLELFLLGTGYDVLHTWQTSPSGPWAEWNVLREPNTSAPPHPGTSLCAARNSDGTLEVFALGTHLEVFHCRQLTAGGAWGGWTQMTNAALPITGTSLAVVVNQDGRLELFLAGTGQDVLQAWQTSPGGAWTEWSFVQGPGTTLDVVAGTNQNGTLEVFALGRYQEVTHRWQTSPGGGWGVWVTRKPADWLVTNDVPATPAMANRIAKEYQLPGIGAEVLAVHAAILPDGKALYFGGSQYSTIQPGQPGYEAVTNSTRLWNPATAAVEVQRAPTRADMPGRLHDVFCSGHALLADGRVLVGGGYGGILDRAGDVGLTNTGLRNTSLYDPVTGEWGSAGDMPRNPDPAQALTPNTGGSWYPTLLTLPTGKVVAMLGSPAQGDVRANNTTVSVFDPQTGAWTPQSTDVPTPTTKQEPTYPRLHLLPDGKVFCTTPFGDSDDNRQCYLWDPQTGAWTAHCTPPADSEFYDWLRLTTSVLLPLRAGEGFAPRILAVGGANPQVLDPAGPAPTWRNTASRAPAGAPYRYNCNAVLLPNGQVAVVGGFSHPEHGEDFLTVLAAELYDPKTDRWQTLAEARVPRHYHAVALLLPDGRIWTAGSQFQCEGKLSTRELRIEVFSPPYLFWGPRPVVTNLPSSLAAGSVGTMKVGTPQASSIASVTLVRCGSTTHGFDSDQRCIELAISGRTATALTVAKPPNTKVAPPGYYFLFVINGNGVPSVGRAIKVTA